MPRITSGDEEISTDELESSSTEDDTTTGDTSGIYADPAGTTSDTSTGSGGSTEDTSSGDTSGIYADPAGTTSDTSTDSGGTTDDSFQDPGDTRELGGFGEELGGDPAESGGIEPAPSEPYQDPGDVRELGGYGEELGGDPAGDTTRTVDRTPAQPFDQFPTTGRDEPGSSEERRLENELVSLSPLIGPGDVVFVERGGRTVATVDRTTARTLARSGYDPSAALVPIRRGSSRTTRRSPPSVGVSSTGLYETGGGEDFGFQGGDPRSILDARIERQLEAAVGASRAEAAGTVDPGQYRQIVGSVDLVEGRDYTVEFERTQRGLTAQASLTEARSRAEAERAAYLALVQQTGLVFEPSEDFVVVERPDGSYSAELTAEGRDQLENPPERFGDVDWSFGLGDPDRDEVERTLQRGSELIQETGERFARAVYDEGGVASESIGEPILTAAGYPELGRQYEEGWRSLGKGAAQAPFAIGNVPALAGAGLEGIEYGRYAARRDVSATSQQTETAGREAGERIYDVVRENPAYYTGMGVGALAASYGLFSAAAAIGPRTGLAARAVVQPGEEFLGYAGYGATSRLASPATAQRYFPNREPLIFSEEAAIRAARRARARGADLLRGEPGYVRRSETAFVYDTGRPGTRAQLGAARERLGGRVFSFPGGMLARTETETSIRPEAETRSLLDDLEGPLRRMEEARKRRAEEAASRARSRFDVETNPMRERPRLRTEVEVEAERESQRRLEVALGLQLESAAQQLGVQQGRRLRQRLLAGLDLDQEYDQELEQELEYAVEPRTGLGFETEQEVRSEAETELKLEVESRNEIEAESQARDDEPRYWERGEVEAAGGAVGEPDLDLGSGWGRETIVAHALGAGVREAPDQGVLEQYADAPFEQRPTQVELTGTEEQLAAIEASEDFFTFDGDDGESSWGDLL